MSNLPDAQRMLELAERAAIDRNFSAADELLRKAARIQEAGMGPLHPDLANTLNSLAIVAERTGRFADAESFYRRSAAIASESLPADHPIVAESRKNLEDFCRERGMPLVPPAAVTPSGEAPVVGLGSLVPEVEPGATASAAPARNTKRLQNSVNHRRRRASLYPQLVQQQHQYPYRFRLFNAVRGARSRGCRLARSSCWPSLCS